MGPYLRQIIEFNEITNVTYVEPYAGGAGVAWDLLFREYAERVVINDLSIQIYCFWKSVFEKTEELLRLIRDTQISIEQRARQKSIFNTPEENDELAVGFSTFFLNRTNRSGILTGGVIGGKHQAGKWKLDARFNKGGLISRIERLAAYQNRVSISNLDAQEFLTDVAFQISGRSLIYLDPPYASRGQDLYQNHYDLADHTNIANLLFDCPQAEWLVSYDAVIEIDALYKQAERVDLSVSYSAQSRYRGNEWLHFSPSLRIPDGSSSSRIVPRAKISPAA
ncbi:MAG: DNA adenine methylase [Chloroflexi bacterium]|nr:DNA adenine methylase [Chloroflexota bacterium]